MFELTKEESEDLEQVIQSLEEIAIINNVVDNLIPLILSDPHINRN